MKTLIKKINIENPEENITDIEIAADILNNGGLVAFPTETVYGLGANALDVEAVKKIYVAKGRPSDNPLIVHISDKEQLNGLVKEITPTAKKLMDTFWPGALTIVFKKSDIVPFETSGGLDTVAIRLPENKIARLLIEKAGIPIAAPSANISGRPSPTLSEHVESDLMGKINMIIDGGNSVFGLESTVVDATGDCPIMLRPGSITADMIEKACGTVAIDRAILSRPDEGFIPSAPGQKYKHYSPKAEITVFSGEKEKVVDMINNIVGENKNDKIGIMCVNSTKGFYKDGVIISLGDGNNPNDIGANLFKTLREFDKLGVEKIYAEAFSSDYSWLAVMNRLEKAAAYNVISID